MIVQVTSFTPYGPKIVIAVVPSSYTVDPEASKMLRRLQPYLPTDAIMLVSIESNGYQAFAAFQTSTLLSLLQLEMLDFYDLDISRPPPESDEELPF